MTYKRLTKAKAEKFTPQNIAYCQAFLDCMATVPKHKMKFFDEAGLDLLVCNPVYGYSEKNIRAVEVVSGKKGPSWTLMLLCSLEGIDYAKMIPVPANTVEYLRFLVRLTCFDHRWEMQCLKMEITLWLIMRHFTVELLLQF